MVIYLIGAFIFIVSGILSIFFFKSLVKMSEWISKNMFAVEKQLEKSSIYRISVGILFLVAGFFCIWVIITKSWTAW